MNLVRCEMSVSKSSRASIPPISANSLKKVDDLREAMPCDKPAGPRPSLALQCHGGDADSRCGCSQRWRVGACGAA